MDKYKLKKEDNTLYFNKVRITIISERLIRLEYSNKFKFIDSKTQMVVDRDFPLVDFDTNINENYLEINTPYLFIQTNGEEFSPSSISISLKQVHSAYYNTWRYGEKIENLGGTARTLDRAAGEIPLDDGIFSKRGYAVIDDSTSMLQTNNFVVPRKSGNKDLYFFGYGHDFLDGLKDFYKLCGKSPMIPRYALGNWWSRYYKYTSKSYLELMDRFEKEEVPFSVAVIDMDWHLVDIESKYGSGWTGYTWNKELFPSPKDFLDELHNRGLKVTVNDHPYEGIRAFEDNYDNIAKHMGIDAKTQKPVAFDASSKKYLDNLQMYILEPLENEGIDFWWIDWQQGSVSKVKGLDPLWILNHHRFKANEAKGNRALIFSRYAGVGSHRYPIGFSGDTVITWESLKFQPKFTSCASNIGYGWWSHDIGGHMKGVKDHELAARWTQYGVFSPIMRLHSSNGVFDGKEPWRFTKEIHDVMNDFLKLRHKLIPYIYTMAYKSFKDDIPLVRPMYYHNSENDEAYENENQYYFGSKMIVAPIVSKQNESLLMASTKVWLPEGNYYDLFNSRKYKGNRNLTMFRAIDSIPVLIKEGSIIPFTQEKTADVNPKSLTLKCYCGANDSFTLYEDDNISEKYKEGIKVETLVENSWDLKTLKINKAIGNLSLIPETRDYNIIFVGVENTTVVVFNEDKEIYFDKKYNKSKKELTIVVNSISTLSNTKIVLDESTKLGLQDKESAYFELLDRCEISNPLKEILYKILSNDDISQIIPNLSTLNLEKDLFDCLLELILA